MCRWIFVALLLALPSVAPVPSTLLGANLAGLTWSRPALAQKPAPGPPAVAPGGGGSARPLAILGRFPAQLGPFARGELVDYAVRANDPRLGASLGYRAPDGSIGTVYLYDGGRQGIAGPGRRDLVDEQLRDAIQDIRVAASRRSQAITGEQAASMAGMRCALFGLGAGGGGAQTGVCLGTHAGLFLKLRLTVATNAQEGIDTMLGGFANRVQSALP